VNDAVTLAIVDASYQDQPHGAEYWPPHRYLTSIANLPLIEQVLDGLSRSGIEQALIVAGQEYAQELRVVLGAGEPRGLRLSYIQTEPGRRAVEVISELRAAVSDQPALIHPGDCLFPGPVTRLRECFRAADLDLLMLASSGPEPLDAHNKSSDSRRRPQAPPKEPLRTALIVGRLAWAVLDRFPRKSEDPMMFLRSLSNLGCRVGVCDLGEHWFYGDSTEELLAANRMLLDALNPEPSAASLHQSNQIQGRVDVSPSALVSDSQIRGPVLIGPGAVVESSFIGPYTAIGAGAVVIGAEIDNTMVLANAQLSYPGCRLEGSVIGERARVSRSFSAPKALHLRLGPGARVILG
jgi:glucose-1-phosphate thymidylyltransferase